MGRERHLGSPRPPVIWGLGTGQKCKAADCKVLHAPKINVTPGAMERKPSRGTIHARLSVMLRSYSRTVLQPCPAAPGMETSSAARGNSS